MTASFWYLMISSVAEAFLLMSDEKHCSTVMGAWFLRRMQLTKIREVSPVQIYTIVVTGI